MKYSRKILKNIYQRIVGAMSGLAEINVQLDDNAAPHYLPSKQTIVISPSVPYAKTEDEEFMFGRGELLHEASHVLFLPPIPQDEDKDFYQWFNIFADLNNEYKVTEIYPHLKKHLADKTYALLDHKPEIMTTDNPLMQVILRCDKICDLEPTYPPEYGAKEFCDEVVKDFNDQKIHKAKGSKLLKFTKEVYEKYKKLVGNDEELKKKIQKQIEELMKKLAQEYSSGGDGKKTKEEIKKLKDHLDNSSFKAKDKVDPDLIREPVNGAGEIDYSEIDVETLKKMLKQEAEATEDKTTIGWGNSSIDINSVTTETPDVFIDDDPPEIDFNHASEQGKKVNRKLRNKIFLKKQFESKHRNGRIDVDEIRRQISKFGRLTSEQLFNRDEKLDKNGEWAVSVLIDCSGSMGYDKMKHAKQALATLAYGFDGIPDLKYEIYGFTETVGEESMVFNDIPIKKFQERRFNPRFLSKVHSLSGNCDGLNIRSAVKRLLRLGNIRKALVVISDGQPAYHTKKHDGITDTCNAVKLAKANKISVIGIGIEGCHEDTLKNIYPTNYMFNKTENLANELTHIILKSIGQEPKKLVKNRWEL